MSRLFYLLALVFFGFSTLAHPGVGIVVDRQGNVFTPT